MIAKESINQWRSTGTSSADHKSAALWEIVHWDIHLSRGHPQ
jgi:hypothetical protein